MAKERKATLVCRPCGYGVTISDLGAAVVECYECGVELEPVAKVVKKSAGCSGCGRPAAKPAARKAPAKKPVAKKPVPKKKK